MFGQSVHVRINTRDYVERLKRCGFSVRLFNWWEDPELVGVDNRYGLLQDESLFLVTKPTGI